jgi:hypothetical protein
MIFIIGIMLLIAGLIVTKTNQGVYEWNKIEIVGIAMSWLGLALMSSSIGILIWKYLP